MFKVVRFLKYSILNKHDWTAFQLCVREVPSSHDGSTDWHFRGFPQYLTANGRILFQISSIPLSSTLTTFQSIFINQPIIRCYTIWATDNVDKVWEINKQHIRHRWAVAVFLSSADWFSYTLTIVLFVLRLAVTVYADFVQKILSICRLRENYSTISW
jgi:hypothetical protein